MKKPLILMALLMFPILSFGAIGNASNLTELSFKTFVKTCYKDCSDQILETGVKTIAKVCDNQEAEARKIFSKITGDVFSVVTTNESVNGLSPSQVDKMVRDRLKVGALTSVQVENKLTTTWGQNFCK